MGMTSSRVPSVGQVSTMTRASRSSFIVLVAASLLAAWHAPRPKKEQPLPVRVAAVQSSALLTGLSYAGEVAPRVDTQLAFIASGRVERRLVTSATACA
jgi:hypothetical protein